MRTFEQIAEDVRRATGINDAQSLRELAVEMETLGTPIAKALSWRVLGHAAKFTGDYGLALEKYRQALSVYEELGDRGEVARITGDIGLIHFRTGDYPLALECFNRALAIHQELGDRVGVATVVGNTGLVHFNTGAYPSALVHYHRALALHEEIDNRAGIAIVTGDIGNVYCESGDYPPALEHYHRALALHEELGNRSGVAMVTGNIGILHFNAGDYPSALGHFQRALALCEELGNNASTVLITGNVIGVLLKLGRLDEATMLLERQSAMVIDSPSGRSLREAHAATLAEHRDDLDAAQRHLLEALAISTEAGLRAESAGYHEGLRDLAQKRNDFAGYIEHNKEYQRITEEVRGKETTQRLATMEAERKMEGERREREKERALLYGALPKEIADRMVRGENVNGDHFEQAAVLFLDVVNFTTNSSSMHPAEVVSLLESVFRVFDDLCLQHNVMKVKTIGDSYMCFAHEGNGEWEMGNSNEQRTASPAQRVAAVALAMQQAEFYWPRKDSPQGSHEDLLERLSFRIGIHSGPVTAGVIGTQRLQYDVWGDTVNVASRMESTSEPGKIHVSEAFAMSLAPLELERGGERSERGEVSLSTSPPSPLSSLRGGTDAAPLELERGGERSERGEVSTECPWHLALRGATELKGKGTMTTYWLE